MALIARINKIEIRVLIPDHNPPHFHVYAAGFAAKIDIEDLEIITGRVPPATLKKVRAWAKQKKNKDALLAKWKELHG